MKRLTPLLLVLLTALSCTRQDRYIQFTGYAQGGTYSVKLNLGGIPGRIRRHPERIRAGVDSILTLVDTTLSGYNKRSQLSRFNAGEPVESGGIFKEIYSMTRNFYDETDGALDMAAGPLFDAWGFGFTTDSLPSGAVVDSLLGVCGMDKLDGNMHATVPGVRPKLNFNAIAQGYTCDLVADYLHALGAEDMLVDIGEIYCDGVNPSGKPWSIGVDRPVDGNMTPGADLDGVWLSDGSARGVVTSGNYRKFYVKDGRKYSHTIDPRTGYPVSHSLLSATVVAPTAAAADAYATYCMVIGLEAARSFILSRPDLEGYLIYDREGVMAEWASDGFTLRR